MAFEDLKTRIYMLLDQMVSQPEDSHELTERIHETLAEIRATGMPLPDDLVELEKKLQAEDRRGAGS